MATTPTRVRRTLQPGQRIRVLVVDDSVVIRRMVTQALEGDPAIEVVGTASNGSIGLSRVDQLNPDIITLDIEMPEVDGLQMLRNLRKTRSDIGVIMFSTLTGRGADASVEALLAGANDYITKPTNTTSMTESAALFREQLLPKIHQFFIPASAPRPLLNNVRPVTPAVARPRLARTRPQVLAIGSSTGGPTALAEVLPKLPANFPCPVLVVQHMPPLFTKLLAERLDGLCALKVREAAEGMPVLRGEILIAPGDFHLKLTRRDNQVFVKLDSGPPENSCRPAVDVLFRSVSEVYNGNAAAVVLTGMGCDGTQGARILRAQSAPIIVQDEASSVVWGMPGSVAHADLADSVLPLTEIAAEVCRHFLPGA